jgi:hypothetical protein
VPGSKAIARWTSSDSVSPQVRYCTLPSLCKQLNTSSGDVELLTASVEIFAALGELRLKVIEQAHVPSIKHQHGHGIILPSLFDQK